MTPHERQEALAKATAVRLEMSEFRGELKTAGLHAGRRMVADVIRSPSPLDAFRLGRLLLSIPWFGEERMYRVLNRAGVRSADRRLRDLSDRQRAILAVELAGATEGDKAA